MIFKCLFTFFVYIFSCLFTIFKCKQFSCLFTFLIFKQKHWFLQSLLPRKTLDFQHFVLHLSAVYLFTYQLFVYFFVSWLFTLSAVCLLLRIFKQNIEKSRLFCQNGDFKLVFVYIFSCLFTIYKCKQFSCLFTFLIFKQKHWFLQSLLSKWRL